MTGHSASTSPLTTTTSAARSTLGTTMPIGWTPRATTARATRQPVPGSGNTPLFPPVRGRPPQAVVTRCWSRRTIMTVPRGSSRLSPTRRDARPKRSTTIWGRPPGWQRTTTISTRTPSARSRMARTPRKTASRRPNTTELATRSSSPPTMVHPRPRRKRSTCLRTVWPSIATQIRSILTHPTQHQVAAIR